MPVRLSPGGSHLAAAVGLASTSLVGSAALGSIFLSTARDSWAAVAAAGPAGPADGMLAMAGLGGTLLCLWLGLGLTLSALSALPGALGLLCTRLAAEVAPSAVRKIVAFVLGTTLTAALIPGTAVAGDGNDGPRPAVVAAAQHRPGAAGSLAVAAPDASFRLIGDPPRRTVVSEAAPTPEWTPRRPAPGRIGQRAGTPPDQRVVVLRGDTLWSIAARHLDPSVSNADIDAEWHRWLAANRGVIGDDPNLILPGQLLRPPPSPPAGS